MDTPKTRTAYQLVAQPGDGTRYPLTLAPREGGGWLAILWDGTHVAKVHPDADGFEVEPVAGKWNAHTRKAVASILSAAFEPARSAWGELRTRACPDCGHARAAHVPFGGCTADGCACGASDVR